MKRSGHEILRLATQLSPLDVSAACAFLINQEPAERRVALVTEVREIVRAHYLSRGAFAEVTAPAIFVRDDAERLWADFRTAILASELRKITDDVLTSLEYYFRPDNMFIPTAYAPRWAPSEWSYPLSPDEVRRDLRLTEAHLEQLRKLTLACYAAKRPKADSKLKIGVLPYADTLALPALLYAISDQVDCLEFSLASFYKEPALDGSVDYVLSGDFDFGYATDYQLSRISESHDYARSRVYDEPFTRSVLLRQWGKATYAPNYEVVSFVGQFAGEKNCDFQATTDGFPEHVRLPGSPLGDLSIRLDPIADWEPELILTLLGNVRKKRDSAATEAHGNATYISTDAHQWAAYSGLISSPFIRKAHPLPRGPTSPRPDVLSAGVGLASWKPDKKNTEYLGEDGAADLHSELNWFGPQCMRTPEAVLIVDKVINRYFLERISDMGLTSFGSAEATTVREQSTTLGRSLLAPLLKCHRWYRGPLLLTPPDQWLVKLTSPAAHMRHDPHWRRTWNELENASTKENVTPAIQLSSSPSQPPIAVGKS